jgi:hypothetical protein
MLLINAQASLWKFVEIWEPLLVNVAQKLIGFCGKRKWNVV